MLKKSENYGGMTSITIKKKPGAILPHLTGQIIHVMQRGSDNTFHLDGLCHRCAYYILFAPAPTHFTKMTLHNLYFVWVLISCQYFRAHEEDAWGRNPKLD